MQKPQVSLGLSKDAEHLGSQDGTCVLRIRDRDHGVPAQWHQVLLFSGTPHTAEQPGCLMINTLHRWETALAQQPHAPLEPVSHQRSVQGLYKGHTQLEESLNSGPSNAMVCYWVYFVLSKHS